MVEREKTEEEMIKDAEEALYGEDKDWSKEDEEELKESLEFLLGD